MAHEDVGVSKVACGGFVLAREGRVEIVAAVGEDSSEEDERQIGKMAMIELIRRLFERAEVQGFEGELGR